MVKAMWTLKFNGVKHKLYPTFSLSLPILALDDVNISFFLSFFLSLSLFLLVKTHNYINKCV